MIKKSILNNSFVRALIAFLLALPSYAFLLLIRNRSFEGVHLYAYVQYSTTVFLGLFLLFELHHWKSTSLERRLSWRKHFNRRLWVELFLSILFVPPIVTGAYAGLYLLVWQMPLYPPSLILYHTLGFFISLLFMGFVNTDYILSNWKASLVKAEQLEKEQVKAQLGELQNQLSPHFLFNHFNILYSLIDEAPDKAKEFLDRLSEIYRYVLGHQHVALIELEKEVLFLEHYIFLMKTRFGDKVQISVNLDKDPSSYRIPPLSLQILLENALKHNEASAERPLGIKIWQEQSSIFVVNNIQPRSFPSRGTQTGLQNIQKRMRFLSDRPVVIKKEKGYFTVELPLLMLNSPAS